MAELKYVKILRQNVNIWNKWRSDNPDIFPDLSGAILSGAILSGANLRGAFLDEADLSGAFLDEADLRGANLNRANLNGANLNKADLSEAFLNGTILSGSNLSGANLTSVKDLTQAQLDGVKYSPETPPRLPEGLALPDMRHDVVPKEKDTALQLPKRIVTYSASVGNGIMISSTFMLFPGGHNQVPPLELILDASGMVTLGKNPPGTDEDAFRDFVRRALLSMAHEDGLPGADDVAAKALTVLEETMAGVTYSPLSGLSLSGIAKLKGGAAYGTFAWLTGEPTKFFVCVLGGIVIIEFIAPVVKKIGEGTNLKLWQKINSNVIDGGKKEDETRQD